MPQRTARPGRTAHRFVFLALAGLALLALRGRRNPPPAGPVFTTEARPATRFAPVIRPARRCACWSARRAAVSFAVTLCFFAGAAFSAGAGDKVVLAIEDDVEPVQVEVQEPVPADVVTPEPAPVAPAEPAPVEAPEPVTEATPPTPDVPVESPAPAQDTVAAPSPETVAPSVEPELTMTESAPATPKAEGPKPATKQHRAKPKPTQKRSEPAVQRPSLAEATVVTQSALPTMWVSTPEPVETPPALRLSRSFAERLATTARRHDADWSVVFGLLRARGAAGLIPASPERLRALAIQAAGVRAEASSLSSTIVGDQELAERAAALARYAKAVGLDTLVDGLEEAGPALAKRVLADERLDIYAGGRSDVELGRIDVRVLALVEYLAETYGQATVSSLENGHRLFSRPGVLSAHVFGRAVDIAAVGGISIVGNQEPGGITEHAVRSILRLPEELQPEQVISLFSLGGPSFAMADHADHIHVGY